MINVHKHENVFRNGAKVPNVERRTIYLLPNILIKLFNLHIFKNLMYTVYKIAGYKRGTFVNIKKD